MGVVRQNQKNIESIKRWFDDYKQRECQSEDLQALDEMTER